MVVKIIKTIGFVLIALLVFLGYVFMDFINFKDGAVPVLMYHGVGVEKASAWGNLLLSPETFEAQLKYLKVNGYKAVSVEELAVRLATNKSIKKYVAITFDDGYINNYHYAYPLLQKYKFTATFYIIRNAVGRDEYMGDVEIKDLLKGGMKIGSHTMSHSNLTIIDKSQYPKEISGSKMLLEQRYGVDIESISYPYGAYNDDVLKEVSNDRYKVGVTGKYGINTVESFNKQPYEVKRLGIYGEDRYAKGFAHTLEKAYFVGYLEHRGIDVIEIRKFFQKTLDI